MNRSPISKFKIGDKVKIYYDPFAGETLMPTSSLIYTVKAVKQSNSEMLASDASIWIYQLEEKIDDLLIGSNAWLNEDYLRSADYDPKMSNI